MEEQLDEKFIAMMVQIEKRYGLNSGFQRYETIRIEAWCKRLCQITKNVQWKKNRNLYCMLLLDQILQQKLSKPFIKMPTDFMNIPMLSPTEVKAQLSEKFKKFV